MDTANSVTFGEAILALGQVVLFAGFLALALERLTEAAADGSLEAPMKCSPSHCQLHEDRVPRRRPISTKRHGSG